MSKLGYFFAGVVAGATALTAAAFMVDDVAHKPVSYTHLDVYKRQHFISRICFHAWIENAIRGQT